MAKLKKNTIENLDCSGLFSELDIHFARFILRFSADQDPDIFLAAALVSRATANGDICLTLEAMSGAVLVEEQPGQDPVLCPPVEKWRQKLEAYPAVGKPGERCPLILDDHNRLYLYRYWEYENKLAVSIRDRASGMLADFNPGGVKATLNRLFPSTEEEGIDWQKVAALIALLKRFSVITGGPGSGKTHAIAGVLALILACTSRSKLNIYLTAPTGKAAARLGESILGAKEHLDCSPSIKDLIPGDVFTIHRLLKPISGTPYFHYNSDNLLPADVVVVDEASMVDLALMSKLLQATAPHTRILIVGDKDQLASVQAGSVLGDVCDRQAIHGFSKSFLEQIVRFSGMSMENFAQGPGDGSGLQDCICVLQNSHRFSSQSGIGGISRAINCGDINESMTLLKNSAETAVEWVEINTPMEMQSQLAPRIIDGYKKYLTIKDPVLAMDAFNEFKILCALHIGPYGAGSVNNLAEQVLQRKNLIGPKPAGSHPWYRGRPVMITRNDYSLNLFNGDFGITLPDPEASSEDHLYVYFRDAAGKVRRFLPHRLPQHETVYALTVHKSQGSEFDQVLLVLPDKDYPLMTRELIYTGLTRARTKVSIWGTEPVLTSSISRKIERSSGLRETLWK
ncbi:MAG: exodeoxyribonuclease V subunit alpha [Desulfobacteraceae bacterium]|jgi:exodeoxyribonuclease V alpha subunit|nr:exodeoxyribonuclease V subunit alpha [Desulfobacteraceae bacterium]